MKTLEKYYNGILGPVSALYEARYNDYCMFMQFKSKYWFDRELQYYNELKDKPYCYDLIDIDFTQLLITFKYEDKNLNHLINENRLDGLDYLTEVKLILKDLEKQGIKKINVYPHTFFVYDGKLKISDLYGCTTQQTLIPKDVLGNIINDEQRFTFIDGYLDCDATYKYTIENSEEYWPEKI